MIGFKCDRCNKWFEGEPSSKGYSRYLHHKYRPFHAATVILGVREEGSSKNIDLCQACVIVLFELFKESHISDYPNT